MSLSLVWSLVVAPPAAQMLDDFVDIQQSQCQSPGWVSLREVVDK